MRFLLVGLFMLNLAVAGLAVLEHFQRDKPASVSDAAELRLFNEDLINTVRQGNTPPEDSALKIPSVDPEKDVPAVAPASRDIRSVEGHQSVEIKTCLLVGPISDPLVLDESRRLFNGYAIAVEETLTQGESTSEYWVYMPSFETKELAENKISELGALGFNSFYISQGEMRGGISLGLFDTRTSAEDLVQRLRSQKDSAQIKELQKPTSEYRLMTQFPVPHNIRAELLGLLAARDPSVEHKEIICK